MAVRNVEAGKNAKEAILKDIAEAKIDVMELDLSSMASEEGVEITANSVNPGVIMTNILRDCSFTRAICSIPGPWKFFYKSVPQGAATTCYVALHPQVKGVAGEYFADCNVANPSSKAEDADLAKRLWDFSLSLTNPN
ncbi:hypothetical protein COLO4_34484 [Corchorus olitorius]|uniref:Short-chain dehydrogenase/reductase SDR n=1 Tax=Corchorus olitorius TaxID=93759 RepID=A0A1R3GKM8_9ROSI|nr:hypothetical protein COLO4_34484 [Corchorus olitorius]